VGRIDEAPLREWEALAARRSLYVAPRWLRSLEESPHFEPRYVLALDGDRLVGALPAYVSSGAAGANTLYDHVELLVRPSQAASSRSDWFPALLGGTRSGYTNELVLPRELGAEDRRKVVAALVRGLSKLADELDVQSIVFFYLTCEGLRDLQPVLTEDSAVLVAGGATRMEVTWSSFDEYLSWLPHTRRYFVRRELRRFAESGLSVSVEPLSDWYERVGELVANVERRHHQAGDPTRWTRIVHEKARELGESALVFLARSDDVAVACSLFFSWEGALYAWAWGCDYDRCGDDAEYFNLVYYLPIRHAIEHGLSTIHFGVEAYRAKIIRGATLLPLWAVVTAADRDLTARWMRGVEGWNATRHRELDEAYGKLLGGLSPEEWVVPELGGRR
jgi:uncharacterized protein